MKNVKHDYIRIMTQTDIQSSLLACGKAMVTGPRYIDYVTSQFLC